MKKSLLALCALALTLVISSCSNQVPVSIDVELVSLELGADGNGKAVVRFVNPTVVAYNLAQSTHRVWLDGRSAGGIEITRPTGLPAQRSAEQVGTFKAEKGAPPAAGRAAYRLESKVTVTLYGDTTQVAKLGGSGTVVVK